MSGWVRAPSKPAESRSAGPRAEGAIGLQAPAAAARAAGGVPAAWQAARTTSQRASEPLAVTKDGTTRLSPRLRGHAAEAEVLAHEAVHRAQFLAAGRPLGTRKQLEQDARRGADAGLSGQSFTPQVRAPPGVALGFEPLGGDLVMHHDEGDEDLSASEALDRSYDVLGEAAEHYLPGDDERTAFFEIGRRFFGSYEATVDYYAAIERSTHGHRRLHRVAADRLDRAAADYLAATGEPAPTPSSGFQLRSGTWEPGFCLGANTGHQLGIAMDFPPTPNPHIRLDDQYGAELAGFMSLFSAGSYHAEAGAYGERRALIRQLAVAKVPSQQALELPAQLAAEATRLGAASDLVQTSLGPAGAKRFAALRDLWHSDESCHDAVLAELPELLAPWLDALARKRDEIQGRVDSWLLSLDDLPLQAEHRRAMRQLGRTQAAAQEMADGLARDEAELAGYEELLALPAVGAYEARLERLAEALPELELRTAEVAARWQSVYESAAEMRSRLRHHADRATDADREQLRTWEQALGFSSEGDEAERARRVREAARERAHGGSVGSRELQRRIEQRLGDLPEWETDLGIEPRGDVGQRLDAVLAVLRAREAAMTEAGEPLADVIDFAHAHRRDRDGDDALRSWLEAQESALGLVGDPDAPVGDRFRAVRDRARTRREALREESREERARIAAVQGHQRRVLGRLPEWEASLALDPEGSPAERVERVIEEAMWRQLAFEDLAGSREAWDRLARLEELLVTDGRFLFGRRNRDSASTPSVAQLVELGFFDQSGLEATFPTAWIEALVRNGFEVGMVWESPDFMHVELAVDFHEMPSCSD